MKIESIHLSAFRCFNETATLTLARNINVIVGINDVGKSSMVAALKMFVASYIRSLGYSVEKDAPIPQAEWKISLLVSELSSSDFVPSNTNPLEQLANPILQPINISAKCRLGGAIFYSFRANNTQGADSEIELIGCFASTLPSAPLIILDSNRNLRASSYTGIDSATALMSTGDNAASIVDELITSKDESSREYERIIAEILPTFIGTVSVEQGKKKLGRRENQTPLDAVRIGAGVLEVAALIAIIVQSRNKVIVVDEIEQSLHPSVLKKLLEIIAIKSVENNLQFIITTHSNIVVSYLASQADSKIIKCFRHENSSDSKLISVDNGNQRADLLKELGYELGDLGLYDGFIITEESSMQAFLEKIIFPKFLPFLSGKYGIIASEGTGDVPKRAAILSKIYLIMFLNKSYLDNSWIVCDGDAEGIETISNLREKYPSQSQHMFNLPSEKQLENYFPSSVVNAVLEAVGEASLEQLYLLDKQYKREIKKMMIKAVLERTDENESFFSEALPLVELFKGIIPDK